MSSPSQLSALPPLLLRAACLLLLLTPVTLAQEGDSSVTSAAIVPGQCIALTHEFDTVSFKYTATFGSSGTMAPGCLLRLSSLYMQGTCSSEHNNRKRGCSTSAGSEVGPSFCKTVFADAPSRALHTPPVPTTSFIKFDAGTLDSAAFKRGYVFAAYNCTNATAAGEASTALEFDVVVEWKYYYWPETRHIIFMYLCCTTLVPGLIWFLYISIQKCCDTYRAAKRRIQRIASIAATQASGSKAQPPPPSTAPVQLAPPSTALVQLAPPPSIAGDSTSVHANVTNQPTASRPTLVDASDSAAGNPPLLTPSPLDPPAAAVDGSSNQTAASHQHVSWRELVTATIRRRGVKAAQD